MDIHSEFRPFPRLPECFVTLRGSVDGLTDALGLILSKLPRQFEHVGEGEVMEQVIIQSANAGKLIGKGGKTIEQLKEQTETIVVIWIVYQCRFD